MPGRKAVVWRPTDGAGSLPIKEIEAGETLLTGDGGTLAAMLDGQNVLFVGKHGADTNDGKNWDKAKKTFTAAIAAASAGDTVVCLDSGTYTERVTVPAGINVFAPNANLVGSGGGSNTTGALNVNDGFCQFNRITNASGESCVVKPDSSGTARVHANEIVLVAGGTSFGLLNISTTQGGVLLGKVDTITCGGGCIGVGSITVNTGHVHIEAEDIYLAGDGAVGLAQAYTSGTMVARIGHILEHPAGTYAATVAITIQDGVLNALVGVIAADTGWAVGASGSLNVLVGSVTGTRTETGTVRAVRIAQARKANYTASTAPTVNNDISQNYRVGSIWINTTTDKAYVCLDSTDGAAVWTEITGGGASAWTALTDTPGSITQNKPVEGGSSALVFGPLFKRDATQAPTVDNDNTEGYAVGSRWIDVTNDEVYECMDAATGAAVWRHLSYRGALVRAVDDQASGDQTHASATFAAIDSNFTVTSVNIPVAGKYRVRLDGHVQGQGFVTFLFARFRVNVDSGSQFSGGDSTLSNYGWDIIVQRDSEWYNFSFEDEVTLTAGNHDFSLEWSRITTGGGGDLFVNNAVNFRLFLELV